MTSCAQASQDLTTGLVRVRRRVRLVTGVRWLLRAGAAGLVSLVLWSAFERFGWASAPPAWAPAALAAAVVAAASAAALARRLPQDRLARALDDRAGLKERTLTAISLPTAEHDAAGDAVLSDAAEHACGADIVALFPFGIRRDAVLCAAAAVVFVSTAWLPSTPLFWSRKTRQEIAEVRVQGRKLEKAVRAVGRAAEAKKLAETRKAAAEARKLAAAIKKGMTRKEAFVKINKLTKKMEEKQRQLAAATSGSKGLGKAAEEARKALEQPKPGEKGANGAKAPDATKPSEAMKQAQEQMRKFADALASKDFDAQQQALNKLGEALKAGGLTPKEAAELSKQMQGLAEALKGTSIEAAAKDLAEAAKLLAEMQLDPDLLKQLAKLMQKAGGT